VEPEERPAIPHHFHAEDLSGKAKMKAAMLQRFQLPHDPRAPVFGVVSRLTAQKGFELFADSIPIFLQREDMRLIVLGSAARTSTSSTSSGCATPGRTRSRSTAASRRTWRTGSRPAATCS
jgi:glycogen synthase